MMKVRDKVRTVSDLITSSMYIINHGCRLVNQVKRIMRKAYQILGIGLFVNRRIEELSCIKLINCYRHCKLNLIAGQFNSHIVYVKGVN